MADHPWTQVAMVDSPWAMVGRDQAAMADPGTRAAMASPGPPWTIVGSPPKTFIGGIAAQGALWKHGKQAGQDQRRPR